MTPEIWKSVDGFEGRYEVSDRGRVRSLGQEVACGFGGKGQRKVKGRVLKEGRSTSGHCSVAVGKGNTKMVHILVCEAFHGPKPSSLHEVLHLDHNPAHNHKNNLRWGTRSENLRHDYQNGSRENFKVAVKVINTRTGEENHFKSLKDASVFLGKPYGTYARYWLQTGRTSKAGFKVKLI